ncbi:DUF1684 domain-containing protein [Arcticibacterium luteifluviistationis]|uniref:DUF1684 domain-containing protein n=1 Tax=Arcticibacterium luteifluviistationis TaxID=1784714 RepID=UPI001E4C3B43|nr:DUF1684 domain-containing protein [Arcticibacterium luteifluviistationis]
MKPIKYLLICLISFNAFGQSDFEKEIAEHRESYKADFLSNSHSPLGKEDMELLDFYEPDSDFKVTCTFKPGGKSMPFEIPTSSGKMKTYTRFGQLKFKIRDKKQTLTVYRSIDLMKNPIYKDYLFIPFKDATSGNSTYGGGRYLDLRMGDISGDEIILDFNKAYNPYCAFSAGYSCPIPPEENHLKVAIAAGEKNFKGAIKE